MFEADISDWAAEVGHGQSPCPSAGCFAPPSGTRLVASQRGCAAASCADFDLTAVLDDGAALVALPFPGGLNQWMRAVEAVQELEAA